MNTKASLVKNRTEDFLIFFNGFIVDPDDYEDLAKKIELVLKNSEQMGKKSREFARRFSWERCAKETVNFYNLLQVT